MNIETLKDIVKVAKDNGVAELKVEGKDYKVSVTFASSPLVMTQPIAHVAQPVPSAVPQVQVTPKSQPQDANLHVIKSPFVGTFYGSASPGKPNFVKIEDKVKSGQTLCILEAMKIMNEIEADIAGEIVEICVDNESLVEFGQPLFKIKK